jgi:polar amino acid transport system permease protein
MNYALNFNLVWRHFDRLVDGLILSLQLAAASIAIGMAIGLALALASIHGNRWVRGAVFAYVEFIRNVPLLLLVYLVFYGLPTVVDIRYDATTSFVATLSLYAGAYLTEVLRAGLEAVPRELIEAGKAIGLTPWQRLVSVRLPTAFRIALPSLSNTYVSLFQGHLDRLGPRRAPNCVRAQWINLTPVRIVEVLCGPSPPSKSLVTGYTNLFRAAPPRTPYTIAR